MPKTRGRSRLDPGAAVIGQSLSQLPFETLGVWQRCLPEVSVRGVY